MNFKNFDRPDNSLHPSSLPQAKFSCLLGLFSVCNRLFLSPLLSFFLQAVLSVKGKNGPHYHQKQQQQQQQQQQNKTKNIRDQVLSVMSEFGQNSNKLQMPAPLLLYFLQNPKI